MIASIDIGGLEERALAEHEQAEERRLGEADIREITELGRQSIKTEELFWTQLKLHVTARDGLVSTSRRAYSARFRSVDGFTRWWLCLIEACALCGSEVATPFSDLPGLGAVLKARETEAACCGDRRECGFRQRGDTWR